jgi:hypothetical protein
MPQPTIPLRSSVLAELGPFLAREQAGEPTTVEVKVDGVVETLQFCHVDPIDGNLVAERLDTGRLVYFTAADVEKVETLCRFCGEDYLTDVSDEDCEARWTGGHALPECSGCGDEVAAPDDAWRHQRCHLIP